MRALILAAGEGSRLRPLTDDRPKPMIPIGGKPVLAHNIELLAAAGVVDIFVNLHYRGEVIVDHFGNGASYGVNLHYVFEPTLLGTAGAAKNIANHLADDDFLVVYGDNIATLDIGRLSERHRAANAWLTMALFPRKDTSASGVAEIDDRGVVRSFTEKPEPGRIASNLVNAGYYVVAPKALALIPSNQPFDFARDLIPELLARNQVVAGYLMHEQLWWIDSIADYERTNAAFINMSP